MQWCWGGALQSEAIGWEFEHRARAKEEMRFVKRRGRFLLLFCSLPMAAFRAPGKDIRRYCKGSHSSHALPLWKPNGVGWASSTAAAQGVLHYASCQRVAP